MDIFAKFATDPKLELEGTWVAIGTPTKTLENGDPDPESAPQILVARSGNKRHGRIVSKLYDANRTLLEGKDEAADAKGDEITIESMAKSILLDWKHLEFKGESLIYSYENAKKLLSVKDFRDLVMKHATDFTKFKLMKDQEDAKN